MEVRTHFPRMWHLSITSWKSLRRDGKGSLVFPTLPTTGHKAPWERERSMLGPAEMERHRVELERTGLVYCSCSSPPSCSQRVSFLRPRPDAQLSLFHGGERIIVFLRKALRHITVILNVCAFLAVIFFAGSTAEILEGQKEKISFSSTNCSPSFGMEWWCVFLVRGEGEGWILFNPACSI